VFVNLSVTHLRCAEMLFELETLVLDGIYNLHPLWRVEENCHVFSDSFARWRHRIRCGLRQITMACLCVIVWCAHQSINQFIRHTHNTFKQIRTQYSTLCGVTCVGYPVQRAIKTRSNTTKQKYQKHKEHKKHAINQEDEHLIV